MLNSFLLWTAPFFLTLGWLATRQKQGKESGKPYHKINKEYLTGLNYLLNEEPDKAVDLFIKMLEVDRDTVETHLALGHLFRRRGEVDRAIRIHQNLIARPHLPKTHRVHALLALGQDYMRAGVLDRAEKLFLEVIEAGEFVNESYRYLLDVYQQERDWHEAIQIAQRLEMATNQSMQSYIAHYYCELAQEARLKVSLEQAYRYLKKAQAADKYCARAYLLLGEWDAAHGQYKQAIKSYKRVVELQIELLPEIVSPLVDCYDQLGLEGELIDYLYQCLNQHPIISIIVILSKRIQRWRGVSAATYFLIEHLQLHPSIKGLKRLMELQWELAEGENKYPFQLLKEIAEQLLQQKPRYRCEHCGYAGKVLHWLCPSCRVWGTTIPIHGLEGE